MPFLNHCTVTSGAPLATTVSRAVLPTVADVATGELSIEGATCGVQPPSTKVGFRQSAASLSESWREELMRLLTSSVAPLRSVLRYSAYCTVVDVTLLLVPSSQPSGEMCAPIAQLI